MGSTSRTSKQDQPEDTKPAKRASATQIVQLLSQRPTEVYKALGLEPNNANLSVPTDGRGARIRASIRPQVTQSVPRRITLAIDDQDIRVPIEVDMDFQEFRPLGSHQAGASKPSGLSRG